MQKESRKEIRMGIMDAFNAEDMFKDLMEADPENEEATADQEEKDGTVRTSEEGTASDS